ncbi:MAG: ABC transporter permease [Actinomycetota bacterium]
MAAVTDAHPELEVRTSEEARPNPWRRLKELYQHREILMNLVRKEIKVKYTSSVLGAAWSMLNPLLFLAVFTLVFGVVLQNKLPYFPVYLLSGILAWNMLSTSLSLSARSVVDNANLVKKVYLPREILPLASVGASLFDFMLQAIVLALFLAGLRYGVVGWNLLLLPLSLVALLLFTCALSLWVGALNVRYRDTQHLLNIGLLTWFWFTPIVYASGFLQERLQHQGEWLWLLYLANPMGDIIFGFQRAIYGKERCPAHITGTHPCQLVHAGVAWEAMVIGAVAVGSVGLLYLFWRQFFKLSGDFAEEL